MTASPLTFRQALVGPYRAPGDTIAALRLSGWPAASAQPLLYDLPIAWSGHFVEPNLTFQLNAWRHLDPWFAALDSEWDGALFAEVLRHVADWTAHERENSADRGVLWQDMAAGLRAAKLAFLVSRRRGDPTLDAAVERHLQFLTQPENLRATNHGFYAAHGLMALARVIDDGRSAELCAFAAAHLTRIAEAQFSAEGVHLEHSPAYHRLAVRTLLNILSSGWYRQSPHLRSLALKAKAVIPWFVLPDGRLTALGDSAREHVDVADGFEDPYAVRFFREAGYVVARSGRSTSSDAAEMLVVTGARHSSMHKHEDDLSFELFVGGRLLFVDAGKFSYGKTPLRAHFTAPEAHNRVDIPADPSALRDVSLGSRLKSADVMPWGIRVEGALTGRSARWARTFLYRPGQGLVLIDHLDRGDLAARAVLLCHEQARVEPEAGAWRVDDVRVTLTAESPPATRVVRGADNPMLGWVSHEYGQRAAAPALVTEFTGPWLVTTISWKGPPPRVWGRGPDLAIRWGDLMLSAPPPSEWSGSDQGLSRARPRSHGRDPDSDCPHRSGHTRRALRGPGSAGV